MSMDGDGMDGMTTLRGGPLDGGMVATLPGRGGVSRRRHDLLLFAADRPSHLWLIDPEPNDPPRGASFHAYVQCSRGHYHYEETMSAYAVLEALARRLIDMDTARDVWEAQP